MRKLLLLCIIATLAHVLSAQTTNRSNAQPATSGRSTPPAAAKPRSNATPAPSTPRSTTQNTTNTRSTSPNTTRQEPATTASQRSATSESATTAGNRTTGTTRTALTTPKTVPSQMPAAPVLKTDEPTVKVQWMTLEEAMEKCKTEKRKIFIDVFTDWCGWCKRMDESTFVDPEVAQYLNDNYYAVKLNAEQQQDIVFNNKTYHFHKNGARGYHELAAELLNNRLSFPTVVFLDESMNVIQPIPGYLEASKLETILNYFGTDSHKTTPWETYERRFTSQK